jgi:hypothetical protein
MKKPVEPKKYKPKVDEHYVYHYGTVGDLLDTLSKYTRTADISFYEDCYESIILTVSVEDEVKKEEYKKALEQYEKDMELWKQHRRETLLIELKNLEKEL